MTLPQLPDWLPGWVPIVVLIPLGLWMLTMLLMPFSVIGVKSRLEGIEARLDEVQSEIRSLVLRLPESSARTAYQDDYYQDRPATIDQQYVQPDIARPPIPPAPPTNDFIPRRPERTPEEPRLREDRRGDRTAPAPPAGPRFDWRR